MDLQQSRRGSRATAAAASAVPPGDRPGLVPRERLVRRLIESRETPVILIGAPAGFGKSTVLGEWRAADSRAFAWLTLGPRDDDPVSLTASIAGVVADLSPVPEAVYAALHGSRPGTLRVAIPRLLEALHASEESLVLALDDLHTLSDPASLEIVTALADGLPEGSQLALASRTQPQIRLNRLRANRALTELGARDLAMTDAEADRLLRSCGLRLHADSVELLVERTEGWPAALYLAALSLNTSDDADRAAREFAGDDRIVADYLRDELVSNLSSAQLDFLTRTSILDQASGELCDELLGTEGSGEVLHRLARENALVTPLDSKDRDFRYHALLREMLASELHRRHAREEAELHARAADAFAARGDYERAVPHRIASGDVEAAADLVWSQAAAHASVGREATLERWLGGFTGPQIESSPPLCLTRATCALAAGDGAGVSRWTGRALALLERSELAGRDVLVVAAKAIRAAGGGPERLVEMRTDAIAAFEILPETDSYRSLCRLVEGTADHLSGDRGQARVALEDGARRGAGQVPSVNTICLSQLALIADEENDHAEAAALSHRSVEQWELHALTEQPTQALVPAVAAFVEARAGQATTASRHAKRTAAMLERLIGIPWYQAETRIMLARALALLDDIPGARAQLAVAGRELRRIPDASVLHEWLQQAWREADAATLDERWPLSPAEIRLLHRLPTHLSFREIAEELFVSANTVKTQARSIYRKLGVSSRAEAVDCARGAGLLDDSAESAGEAR